jgi:uncharacterized metal-binding protein YceD (DUF177 family)
MHNKHDYDIAFVGLKQGEHVYEYSIDDKFFEVYGKQEFENCKLDIKLTLDKAVNLMKLKFEVGGKAQVLCDRCSNDLDLELWEDFVLFIKQVDNADEMNDTEEDPDVFYIERGESILKIADWIYEFVNLSIPYQRTCNDDEIGGPKCNKEVLDFLKKSEELVKQAQTSANNVWEGLPKTDNNN